MRPGPSPFSNERTALPADAKKGAPTRRPRLPSLSLLRQQRRDGYRAFFATSTIAVKAAGSFTAMSASTLRSSSTPAFLRPFMNTE